MNISRSVDIVCTLPKKIMAQSLIQSYLHITFATQLRKPFLDEIVSKELYPYLTGVCKNLECPSIQINGHIDHVHILCMMSGKISVSDLLNKLKSNSSRWIKTKGEKYKNFAWQEGYFAASIGIRNVENVKRYILNQAEHHKTKTMEEEYRELLKEAGFDSNDVQEFE